MCSPCGPMVCYKYEDCGPPKSKTADGSSRVEEDCAGKKDEKENQLKRTKSRELRAGIMYYSCHCIKRNGLQHDCRRTGCGGEPACLVLPDPVCAPSQLARARGLADPAALAAHTGQQSGGGSGPTDSGLPSGKRFIVCELKSIIPDISADKSGKCCECSLPLPKPNNPDVDRNKCTLVPIARPIVQPRQQNSSGCPCGPSRVLEPPKQYQRPTCPCTRPKVVPLKQEPSGCCPCVGSKTGPATSRNTESLYVFDEKTLEYILSRFENKELAPKNQDMVVGPGGRARNVIKPVKEEEPCSRPGCVHWQPPSPCVWDLPCKADCFETPPGIQPGRNPLTGGLCTGGGGACPGGRPRETMKLLTPEF